MSGRRLFKLYQDVLHRRPYMVQAVQTSVLMGAGDLICQTFIEKKDKPIDFKRALRFSSIGFFLVGPAVRTWYGILNRFVGSSGTAVTIKKVLLDQCLFAPSFICVILITVGITQGRDWRDLKNDIRHNYADILITNYYIWPMVQLVNFYFVPLQYQVLLAQMVALFWNTYLSWKTNKRVIESKMES